MSHHIPVVTWEARGKGRPVYASCSCGKRCRHLRRAVRQIRFILAATKGLL